MSRPCTDVPPYRPRFQWEQSSGTFDNSQSNNCGPTGASQQADYYASRDSNPRHFAIEKTRRLVSPPGVPTSAWDQAQMFTRRTGIGCSVVTIESIFQLENLLNDHRPVGIGILMSRLTARTRGHSFLGWHRVTLLAKRRRWRMTSAGPRLRRGFLYTDPNFHPKGTGYREDPKHGHRWISRRELDYAYVQNFPAYAIVPDRAKG